MLKAAAAARRAGLRLFDLAILVAAFPIAFVTYCRAMAPDPRWLPPLDAHSPVVLIAIVLWTASAWVHEVYEAPVGRSGASEIVRALRALGTVALALAAIAFLTKQQALPRLMAVLYVGIAAVLFVVVRVARRLAASAAVQGPTARRYAVVGSGGLAREIVESIAAHPEWGLRFSGFIHLDSLPERTRGPELGRLSQLGRLLEDEVLDVVIFAVPREHLGEIERGIQLCEEQGVEVRISLDMLRVGPGRMSVADLDGVPMLAFTRTPIDVVALAAKRAFDVAASGLALIVLGPVLAAIAIAIRLESPGPFLFRQRRTGLNGRAFDMLKFRSMYQDAEARLEALRSKNEMSGPVFKMARDPRVTRVGRIIRRTSLDELPQFWNVLRGQMSIVGPRPPIPAEVRQYKRWQRRRLSMKPGITCIWQISGRNNIDFERWMELDLEYIDTWSLWSDIAICLKTIPAVLSTRGAR